MKVLELNQNTPEWEEFRRAHIGASDAPAICGIDPYKNAYRLWKEKALGEKRYVTESMRKGTELEPRARLMAQEFYDMEFSPLCILHDSRPYAMASLDGFNANVGLPLEIKVVGNNTFDKVMRDGALDSWKYQIHHQMDCIDAHCDVANLFVLNSETNAFLTFSIFKDKQIVEDIIPKEEEFFQRMLNFNPPEDTHVMRDDDIWKMHAEQFLIAKEHFAIAEARLKACKAAMIESAGEDSSKGHGVTVTKYMYSGTVNYKKIPQLKGVDLSAYKEGAKETWRVA